MRTYRLHFALTLMVVFSISLTAQIQFTSSDAQGVFAVGKYWIQFRHDSANTTMDLKVPSTTVAQSWTFPTVAYIDSGRQDNINPASSIYGSSFPSATHAQRQRSLVPGNTGVHYNYTHITADTLSDVGEVDSSQTVSIRQRKDLFGLFPLTVSQTIASSRDSTDSGSNSWEIQTRTASFDAFGTITSSAGAFQTLRRKETRIRQMYVSGSLFSSDTSVDFLWLTKDNYFFGVDAQYAYRTTGSVPVGRVEFNRVVTTTAVEELLSSPQQFQLQQNYPNPFNPTTNIGFDVKKRSYVSLRIYNLLGQEVAMLVNEVKQPGSYKVPFDGSWLKTGVYFYKLTTDGFVETRKMVLLK